MDFLAICELDFANRNFLEEADPIIVLTDKTRIASNVFDEIPNSSCCVVVHCDMCYCKGIRNKGEGSKFWYMVISNTHFSCINESGNSIECSQDGMIGVVMLVAYTNCIVVGRVFCSIYIELSRTQKTTFLIVREDYMVHNFHRLKKLPFESSVNGSFGLQDKGHILEGGKGINTKTFISGLLTYRMMTMTELGILKHFSSKDVEQRKLDVAFTVANHIPKLVDGFGVLGSLLLKLWSSNLLWGASITLLPVVEAIIAIPPCTIVIVWDFC